MLVAVIITFGKCDLVKEINLLFLGKDSGHHIWPVDCCLARKYVSQNFVPSRIAGHGYKKRGLPESDEVNVSFECNTNIIAL